MCGRRKVQRDTHALIFVSFIALPAARCTRESGVRPGSRATGLLPPVLGRPDDRSRIEELVSIIAGPGE
jgi:hypothetical protein